jgi:hypothetical protein
MKTFKQLREAVKREPNPEAEALKPRAQGEQDFVDSHSVDVKDYPVSPTAHDHDNEVKKTTHQPGNGDRGVVKQGNSDLKDQSGFKGNKTPLTRADQTQGDMKPVRLSPSAVKESIFVNKPVISESGEDTIEIELLNGDTIEINEDIYNSLVDVFEMLNTGNQAAFKAAVNESADTFEHILDFVASLHEEQ